MKQKKIMEKQICKKRIRLKNFSYIGQYKYFCYNLYRQACRAMLCRAMLCMAMLCRAILCRAML